MKNTITSRDIQRDNFVKTLYANIRRKTKKAIIDHNKMASRANTYLNDGLDPNECVELLILDGLTRDAASNYVEMAQDKNSDSDNKIIQNTNEYSFSFEDSFGKIWSSQEIHKTILASSHEEAWRKTEELLNDSEEYESEKILSVELLEK